LQRILAFVEGLHVSDVMTISLMFRVGWKVWVSIMEELKFVDDPVCPLMADA
jgi:hypothetical protein